MNKLNSVLSFIFKYPAISSIGIIVILIWALFYKPQKQSRGEDGEEKQNNSWVILGIIALAIIIPKASNSKGVQQIVQAQTIETPSENIQDRLNKLPVDGEITSKFGNRIAPIAGGATNHRGVDISVPIGTKVKTLIGGSVRQFTDNSSGHYIIVKNGEYEEVLCHLSKMYNLKNVKPGDYVGESGNSGSATTGAHLHFGLRINGTYVDPLKYIKQ